MLHNLYAINVLHVYLSKYHKMNTEQYLVPFYSAHVETSIVEHLENASSQTVERKIAANFMQNSSCPISCVQTSMRKSWTVKILNDCVV